MWESLGLLPMDSRVPHNTRVWRTPALMPVRLDLDHSLSTVLIHLPPLSFFPNIHLLPQKNTQPFLQELVGQQ